MMDVFNVLNMGTRALSVQQKGIYVTGNNIANVNTPGYSRQRLNLSTDVTVNTGIGPVSGGVTANSIERIYQRFLGAQINNETQTLGQWEARKNALERVEMIFNESGGYGLNQVMNEFWNSWQDLTNNPSGSVERTVLAAKSEMLAATFSKNHADLMKIQKDIDSYLEGAVKEINRLSENMADLNQKIVQMESAGHAANDYRDQRDLILKKLSEFIDIDTFEDANGGATVSVGTGQVLVEGTRAYKLSTQANLLGHQDVTWLDSSGNTVIITNLIEKGKLKGWLDARDVDIADSLSKLDTLAQNLMTEVNTIHANGYGLDGSTGNDFFIGAATAAGIRVNPLISNDTNLIAAAKSFNFVPGDKPGDNGNAIAIANLQAAQTMNGNTTTFGTFYDSMVSDAGLAVQQAASHFEHQSQMVLQVENYRESISGVSIDEETVNLIKFQNAYQAAAKLINTADEMMQTVLNMI
ncbi:MAG: flagellar hook-associated protein FlgK [Desulfobacterales bacterium]|jgi:flagellar hook-associated protein 1 FlgK